ncbi:hypothetical protein C8A03DRAFT_12861 [Achaetomium macrosporum]|uniref:Uncharacterized protein n=1 Tax=Achaetomium macrosporum TaxID=79813 RepID=A0AAN7CF17_9PEZI|nr:hypothetical protein C8A03DRAFT_12861 [Achaetomium macrosporum]
MFSIRKKLIPSPQKKPDGPEDYEGSYFYHDDDDEMDTLSRIKTWRPPMGLMKRSKPSINIRRSEDLHRIICIPPLPDTPQSSTTSLCSIDNGTGYVVNANPTPRASPPRRPDRSPLGSPLMGPQRSPQRSPLLLPQQIDDQQQISRGRSPVSAHSLQHPQLTPPSSPPQHADMFPQFPQTPAETPDTVPSTPETSTHPPALEVITVTPPPETAAEGDKAGFSPEAQQLMHETDEAFKLRQPVTVTNAKLPDHELDKFPKLKDPSPVSPPVRRKSQRRSQGSVKSVKSPTKTSMKDPLLPAQARLPSNSRPKRAKSKKSRRRPRAPVRQSSMWQLTESAKDLFTIRIFHRIEVDEMLPESTLREIRMSRAAHWTRSPELGVTHDVDRKKKDKDKDNNKSAAATPIDPLSLDKSLDAVSEDDNVVTPRASVLNQGTGINQEDCKTPTLQPEEQLNGTNQDSDHGQAQVAELAEEEPSLPLQQPDSPTTKSCDGDEDEGSLPIMMVEDASAAEPKPIEAKQLAASPMPPPLKAPPMHRRLPSRQLPPLPTIPEVVATGPEEATLSPTSAPQPPGSASKVNTDDYVFLDSTPYTLAMPAFRHGRIRLAKADLPIGKLAAAVDDTLDWTAFQMAILGGAGDFFSEPTDYSRPSEAELEQLEELASWFGSFGFDGPGSLIGPSEPRTPTQGWTPVLPRTPALTPPSPTSTPGSSPRTVVGSNTRNPGFRRIDPPAPSEAEDGSNRKFDFGDSIAGRFFPTVSLGLPVGHTGGSNKPGGHRRSVSSTTFGHQPLAAPPVLKQSASFESRGRNHGGLAIDSGRRPSVDSIQSLPQSPMMDLVVSHDVEGNEYMVPMGFNLSHDLGDFLTWHAEHVSGAGFAVPDGSHI